MSARAYHIGCSGFHYKEWKEAFYPKGLPQRRWFEHYCTYFNTLELNNTFYRFPELKNLESWYLQSPPAFRFSVKAPRLITHYKKFNDTQSLLDDFYGVVREGLRDKEGPVLFQFPAQERYNEDKLHQIIEQLDTSFTNVLEFRDAAWWRSDVYRLLGQHKIVFCGMSHPQLPDEVVINTSTVYYRFHGTPRLYYSEYPISFLDNIRKTIQDSPDIKTAWLYFNNTAAMAAIHNAIYLRDETAHNNSAPMQATKRLEPLISTGGGASTPTRSSRSSCTTGPADPSDTDTSSQGSLF